MSAIAPTLLLLAAATARASGNYPAVVQDYAGMPCRPSCMLCHETMSGGTGTATRPFAQALQARGLTGGGDTAALRDALAAMDTDGVDSDGDGTPDIDELSMGMNPNGDADFCPMGGDGAASATEPPSYGCAAAPAAPAALLALAGLALAGVRRRR